MERTIRFYYGFEERTLSFGEGREYTPDDTLLFYLRQALGVKATREGCGVGDCGACTVVLAEWIEGKMVYYPVNACLVLLPSIDGKWLIISKHLRQGEALHPVQDALLKQYGVQCGFCTSGMLMSMFAMYKNTVHPSRRTVEERMTGNLCRCTGYRSILDATIEACDGAPDQFSEHESQVARWMVQNPAREFFYDHNQVAYYRPVKLEQALIWHHREQHSTPCCGTSDLVAARRKQTTPFTRLLDLSGIEELRGIALCDKGLTFGASVSVERVRNAAERDFPQIYDLLGRFASFQIRQVASLAGNLASSSPIGDTIPMLMAHHAEIIMARMENDAVALRRVPASEFITGYKKNALEHNELIHSVFIPHIPSGVTVCCFKVSSRRSVDISTVNLSVRMHTKAGVCQTIELYYGGMAEVVRRAHHAEQALCGHPWNEDSIRAAQEALSRDFTPISDGRATASRRMELAGNLLEMLLNPESL